MATASGPSKGREFYRKPLPSSCIDFASNEGKEMFREALNQGTMNCFFNLAAQFRTQDEPAYCGLSTLVMVLNALSVDPGRIWKGPWRWYHENMLDCCVPLDVVKEQGITFFHFSRLAVCNGLDVDIVRALPSAKITDFRDIVERVTQSDSQVLVCSYSRKILSQTGDGHYSPIGGYHAGRDMVLIFDVARFKYPPHWVTVDLLWTAMQALDKETGQPRGYLTMNRTLHTGNPTVLFKISEEFSLKLPSELNPKILEILQQWQIWLMESCPSQVEKKEFLLTLISKFLSLWFEEDSQSAGASKIITIKLDANCCAQISQYHRCAICDLLQALEELPLFQIIKEFLTSGKSYQWWDDMINIQRLNDKLCCSDPTQGFPKIKLDHFVSIMLLSWPYPSKQPNHINVSRADYSAEYISQDMTSVEKVLENEVSLLKSQFSAVFSYYKSFKSAQFDLNETKCCQASHGSGCKKQKLTS